MITKSFSIPEALNRHLSTNSHDDLPGIARYVDEGAELVTPDAIAALEALRAPLHAKINTLDVSSHLRHRIELLATYFDETAGYGAPDLQTQRDTTFALLYFLKGFDRIPDTVPEVGLLDDAMIVQTVLQRHATTLRAHWLRHGRPWPAEL